MKLYWDDVDFGVPSSLVGSGSGATVGERLDETDLHYFLFRSKVTFEVHGQVVIGPRRRVPFFDFLACTARSLTSIRENEAASMGFTEAADRVFYRPATDDTVEISTSESPVKVRCDRQELIDLFTESLAHGREQLIGHVPGIERNPYMAKLSMPS